MYENPIRVEARVIEVLKPGLFRVELPNGKCSLGHLSKSLRRENPEISAGSRVELELTPYDFDTARISGVVDCG